MQAIVAASCATSPHSKSTLSRTTRPQSRQHYPAALVSPCVYSQGRHTGVQVVERIICHNIEARREQGAYSPRGTGNNDAVEHALLAV